MTFFRCRRGGSRANIRSFSPVSISRENDEARRRKINILDILRGIWQTKLEVIKDVSIWRKLGRGCLQHGAPRLKIGRQGGSPRLLLFIVTFSLCVSPVFILKFCSPRALGPEQYGRVKPRKQENDAMLTRVEMLLRAPFLAALTKNTMGWTKQPYGLGCAAMTPKVYNQHTSTTHIIKSLPSVF